MFRKIHRKTPVLESLLNKVADLFRFFIPRRRTTSFQRRVSAGLKIESSTCVCPCEFSNIFKNRLILKDSSDCCFGTFVITSHLSINSEVIPLSQIHWQGNFNKMIVCCGIYRPNKTPLKSRVARRCLKERCCLKFRKNLQESTCPRLSLLIKLQSSGLQLY